MENLQKKYFKQQLTCLVHIISRNFLYSLSNCLPWRYSFFFHSGWWWSWSKGNLIFRFNIIRTLCATRFHVYDIEAKSLLLDPIVCIDGDGIVIVVIILNRCRLNVKLLSTCVVITDDVCRVIVYRTARTVCGHYSWC